MRPESMDMESWSDSDPTNNEQLAPAGDDIQGFTVVVGIMFISDQAWCEPICG